MAMLMDLMVMAIHLHADANDDHLRMRDARFKSLTRTVESWTGGMVPDSLSNSLSSFKIPGSQARLNP